jgi:hypothetical protein
VGVERIVAGGQTGADRAALDVALEYGLMVGGWVPRGRLAEDGRIPARYPGLVETESADVAERTRLNVRDADATLIVSRGPLGGGSKLTLDEARRQQKPVLHLDVGALGGEAAARLREWLAAEQPHVLNVAGPRASEDGDIYVAVATLLRSVFNRQTIDGPRSLLGWLKSLGSLEESTWLRAFGIVVLVAGLVGSGAFYVVQKRSAPPQMDELSAPGFLRARRSQQRIMMGPMGTILTEWQDTLQQPGVQALIIAGVSVLVSWGFLRIASRLDDETNEDTSRHNAER